MMTKLLGILFVLFTSIIYANEINIDENKEQQEILSFSQIYVDKTRVFTIEDIQKADRLFKNNDKSVLGFGYSPDFDVWIKFTLKNNTDETVRKILEYGNSMTTDIVFYDMDNDTVIKEGLLHTSSHRNSINPVFDIIIPANESKTYYIKTSSHITTLIIKLNLYDIDIFYKQEVVHQVVLALFFGAMMVLVIYNIFIYFFTKDISYLFYVMYIFGISVHHTLYVGIANLYIVDNFTMNYVVQYASFFIAFPIFFLALFSKSFLQTNNYPIINKVLNIFLVVFFISIIFFMISDTLKAYRNIFSILMLMYLIIVTVYLALKKNRQGYFVVLGWLILLVAGLTMYLSSIGVINIYKEFPYIIEMSLLSEAILFSIALSDKINRLQKEKNNASEELIVQKKTENERLEIQVEEKTKDLNISLEEKTLLLQEVNHRVKNNMQMIVSLIRLQSNDIDDKKIQNIFLTTQNRLNAMSQLHELLYQKDDVSYVNAYEYFTNLIEGLEETYTNEVNINYLIDADLQTEQAISSGIILNELVTNSLKYAFPSDDGEIAISLSKDETMYTLVIKDNGIGYDNENLKKSFGLILVDTLVSSKLRGKMTINTKNGVETTIKWSEEND